MGIQAYLANYTEDQMRNTAQGPMGIREHRLLSPLVSVAAADSDTSTYILFKDVPSTVVVASLPIETEAITGGTSYDVGLYDSVTGVVADADILAAGLDFSSAATKVAPLDGLKAVTLANRAKPLYALLGLTLANCKPTYDIVVTANTVGSGAGTFIAAATFLPGG
jgi:hypothetical protein